MDAGLDTGPMLSITRCPIGNTDTSGSIYARLEELGGPALLLAIDKLDNGTSVALAQNNSLSSYAAKIDKAEAEINWADSANVIDRRIRAFNPFPCTYSKIDGQRVKIWAACLVGEEGEGTAQSKLPGEILCADQRPRTPCTFYKRRLHSTQTKLRPDPPSSHCSPIDGRYKWAECKWSTQCWSSVCIPTHHKIQHALPMAIPTWGPHH